MLDKLGPEKFGIWALVSVIFGVFSAFDLGTGVTFVKFFSEYHVKKDHEGFNRTLFTGFFFIAIMMSVLVLFAFLINDQILRFLKIPQHLHESASFVFLGTCLILAIYKTCSIFTSILTGLQRMDITNNALIVASFIHAAGTIVVLEIGLDLEGLLLIQGFKFFVIILVSIYFSNKLAGPFKIKLRSIRFSKIRELLDYGFKMQISNIASLAILQIDKTLIGYFVSLGSVSIYEIGQKIALFYRMIVTLLLSALVPAISELNAEGKQGSILKLYTRGNKYLFAITFPVAVFIYFSAKFLVISWIGNGFENSILVTKVLILGVSINMLTGIGTAIVRGIGKPIYETRYTIICLLLNISLGILLATYYGFWGIIIASPISVAIGSIYFIFQFHWLFKIKFIEFFKLVYLKPFIISFLAIMALIFVNEFIQSQILFDSRWQFVLLLLFNTILYFPLYVFLLKKSNFWDKDDLILVATTTGKYPFLSRYIVNFI